jgi:DNA-binding winged helix-turn-helix (wHTH) protein/TolB-like protein/Tfp pilus assembly protein PilF
LDPAERRLLRGREAITLTPKAYDTLLVLVENAGRGLDKDELIQRIWPDTFVEEGSLTRNIYLLRKALGDENGSYIETLPKRGYRFVAPLRQMGLPDESVVVDEHTVARVVIRETETAGWFKPSVRLLAGAVLFVLVASAVAYLAVRVAGRPFIRSLAVLPLKNLGGSDREQRLELGVADSIIGRVSEIAGLTVRPTGAIRRYLDSSLDPLQAARELQVDAVLDGTLQIVGDRIRVNLNLLRTAGGASLWTQAFEMSRSDLFDVEDEIARQVAGRLRQHVDSTGQARAWQHSTKNPEAYEHYLKGLYSDQVPRVTGGTRANLEAAVSRFRKATDLDPSYAQAWAQLALSYTELQRFYQPGGRLEEDTREAVRHANALDPDLPELHVLRSITHWSWNGHYRVEDSIRELRRAAGYNSSDVHSRLGAILFHAGLDTQAIAELKRAIEIDPTNALHLDRLAQAYVWAGRFEEARKAYERAFAMEPEGQGSIAISAVPFLYERQFDEARRRLEKGLAYDPKNVVAPAYMALLAAVQGHFQEAEAAVPAGIGEMEKLLEGHHAFYAYASVYALEGKSADAVWWLGKTVETGMPDYPMFARDPNLARIRGSAEFRRFMSELKTRWDAIQREFH